MISSISNGAIYAHQLQQLSSMNATSSNTNEKEEDSVSSKNGNVATINTQSSDVVSKAQATINASLLNQHGDGKPAGGPPPGGHPPGGPPAGAGPEAAGASDSYLVDLMSIEEDEDDETTEVSVTSDESETSLQDILLELQQV